MLFVLQLAFGVFEPNPISALITGMIAFLPKLIAVAGVLVVGAGGGLIKPMQTRWESYLTRAEEEAPRIRQQTRNAPSEVDQARATTERAQNDDDRVGTGGDGDGHGRHTPRTSQKSGATSDLRVWVAPRTPEG